ncbi:MAG: S-layer homology domain-containing protein [Thermoleophilia bacterium]
MNAQAGRGRAGRALTTAAVSVLLLLAFATLASAAWPDLPSERLGPYGVSEYDLEQISQGYADGHWRPDGLLSRAQFAKMAVRDFSLPAAYPAAPSYSDVPATHFYFADIEAAAAAGLIHGRGDGTFDPSGYITRQEAVAIVSRGLATLRGVDLAGLYGADRLREIVFGFQDGGDVSSALGAELAFAAEEGLIRGTPEGKVNPLERITRIQGAALLVRAGRRQTAYGTPRPYVPTTIWHTPTTGPGSAVLSGAVTAEGGGGVFGFASLMDAQGSGLEWTYLNDGYTFEGLVPGDYRLAIYSPYYVSEFYGGLPTQTHSLTDSPLIHVGTDDITADFVLAQGQGISGLLAWAGLPPQTALVSGSPQGMEPPWLSLDVAVYDEMGNRANVRYWEIGGSYALWGLIPGVYTVMAHAGTSGGSEVDTWFDGVHSRGEATSVDISTHSATDVDLYLGVLSTGPTTVTTTPVTTIPVIAISSATTTIPSATRTRAQGER